MGRASGFDASTATGTCGGRLPRLGGVLLTVGLALGALACSAADTDGAAPARFGDSAGDPGTELNEGPTADGDCADSPEGCADSAPEETPDAGPELYACDAPQPCASAEDLGSLSGDTDGVIITRTGTTSKWFRIRVTEDRNGDPRAYKLKLRAELVSPSSSNFDLFVYVNEDEDLDECSEVSASSEQPAGATDEAKLEWGENTVANRKSDARTVAIEVRAKNQTCSSTEEWSLVIQGNI